MSRPFAPTWFNAGGKFVLGADAKGAVNAIRHDLQMSRAYFDKLPQRLREHLTCRVVPTLEPIHQAHQIEGLVMGAA